MSWIDHNDAWLDGTSGKPIIALKRAIHNNFRTNAMVRRPQGIVLHIMQGNERGTWNHFNTAHTASAHFGNPRNGMLWQYVSLKDLAWAQGNGLYWISVENAGWMGSRSHQVDAAGERFDLLNRNQIENLGRLAAYLWIYHRIETLRSTDDPAQNGIGYHAMGGASWGAGPNGHHSCPGRGIINQRQAIIECATTLITNGFPN